MRKSTIVFALLLASLSARASDETAAGTETVVETIVVTAARRNESAVDGPQAVSVVTHEQIERSAPQVMVDLLRGQPGVFTPSSGPGQGIVIVRGLKGSEVLHLVDGMRLNNSLFRNAPSQYIALLDPYNVAQIEVLRGPAAALYGSDAMGGVLQVLTPEPRFETREWQTRIDALAQYGSADISRVTRLGGKTGREGISVSGGFSYADHGARDIAGDGRQDFTAYRSRAGDAKLIASPAEGQELMLSWQYFNIPKLARYHEIVGGPGGAGSGPDRPIYFEPNGRRFLHARYRLAAPLPGIVKAEIHAARQVMTDDRSRVVDDSTREHERNQSALSGYTLQALTPLGPSLELTWGAEFYRDDVNSSKARTNLETGEVSPRPPTFADDARQDSLGVYVGAEWRMNPALRVDAGARYSKVKTDVTATVLSPSAGLEHDDLTGHLGSIWQLTEELAWTANLARGFRAPNLFDLGTLGPRAGTDPQQLNIPNPDLVPETINSVDSGLRFNTRGLSVEGVLFYSRYEDRIEPREPTGNTIPNGSLGCTGTEDQPDCIEVQSRNISAARYWGAELGFRYHRRPLEAYATLNWTRGEELRPDGTQTPANRIPPLNGQAGLLYDFPGGWSVEPYVLFSGRQSRLDDDDLSDVRIDPDGTAGWATANLRLAWSPEERWRLQLALNNLLDKPYREHGSGIDAPGLGMTLTASVHL